MIPLDLTRLRMHSNTQSSRVKRVQSHRTTAVCRYTALLAMTSRRGDRMIKTLRYRFRSTAQHSPILDKTIVVFFYKRGRFYRKSPISGSRNKFSKSSFFNIVRNFIITFFCVENVAKRCVQKRNQVFDCGAGENHSVL